MWWWRYGFSIYSQRNTAACSAARNSRPVRDCRTICAHELGHDRLHQHLAKDKALQEFMLYDMRSRPEYEANIFAGELLIDDDEVLALVEDGYDVCQIADELGEDMNLVLIKIDELRKQGHDLSVPYRPASDFLGRD